MFGIGSELQKVGGRRNKDRVRVIHLEIMDAQMMLSEVVVRLGQIFICVLTIRPTVKVKLIVGSFGKRDMVQNVGGDRAYRNLIVSDVPARSRVYQLEQHPRSADY